MNSVELKMESIKMFGEKRQTRNDNHDKGIIALEFEINRDNRASLSYFGLIGIFSFSIPFRGRGKQDAIEEYQRITVCYQ